MQYPIAFYYPAGHEQHSAPGHDERPERVEAIRAALMKFGYWDKGIQVEAQPVTDDVLHTVHTAELLETVKAASANESNIDPDTYLTKASWQVALNAAGGAAALARAVWNRDAATGFALTRPPGHHATRRHAMGFCLLNNVALAAETLIQSGGAKRLAICDLDVHHGNGTQDIFYERGDVMFFSTHQVPLYPGGGQLNERGRGAGEGKMVNLPLPPHSGDDAFAVAYGEIVPKLLSRFEPEMILVSVGFDAHWRDPLAQLQMSARAYGEVIASLTAWANEHCMGRIALFLEGGYDLDAIAACGVAVTQALLGEKITDTIGPSREKQGHDWMQVFDAVKEIWELT